MMAGAMNWILDMQQAPAAKEKTEEGKKRSPSPLSGCRAGPVQGLRPGQLPATRPAPSATKSASSRPSAPPWSRPAPGGKNEHAGSRIGHPADRQPRRGLHRDRRHPGRRRHHDPGHLHPVRRVPAEVQKMDKKNLALEALRKLLNGDIRVPQQDAMSSRPRPSRSDWTRPLPATTPTPSRPPRCLQELIKLAKEIRSARQRGEEQGSIRRGNRLLRRPGGKRKRRANAR